MKSPPIASLLYFFHLPSKHNLRDDTGVPTLKHVRAHSGAQFQCPHKPEVEQALVP
jgi:hypothetical protein